MKAHQHITLNRIQPNQTPITASAIWLPSDRATIGDASTSTQDQNAVGFHIVSWGRYPTLQHYSDGYDHD